MSRSEYTANVEGFAFVSPRPMRQPVGRRSRTFWGLVFFWL